MKRYDLIKEFENILEQAEERTRVIDALEDEFIRQLCERIGYGAAMDSASRMWMKKDPDGAFIIAGCAGKIRRIIKEAEESLAMNTQDGMNEQ